MLGKINIFLIAFKIEANLFLNIKSEQILSFHWFKKKKKFRVLILSPFETFTEIKGL